MLDSNALGLLTPQVPICYSSSIIFDHIHVIPFPSVLCAKAHEYMHKEKKISFLPHSFTFITLEISIKMYLTVSHHSLMSWPHLSINNSISSTKIYTKEKKPTTKRRLRNRAIKYESETLFVYLFNQNRGCCSCRSFF